MKTRRLLLLGLVVVLVLYAIAPAQQKVLYEKESDYGTIVVTEDSQGLRTLLFEKGGIRQSVVKLGDPDHIELPYARTMPVGLALIERPRRVLIVGLGGGTIPGFLHKHFPQMTIDVVDIDPVVVEVAKRFFGFREDATLHVYVDDGRRFIEKCREPYDVIFLDAYGSENVPYHLTTREFLQAVRRALTPDGAVVANIFSRGSNRLYDSMIRTYQDGFAEVHMFDVRGAGNEILLALPKRRAVSPDELARRASKLSQQRQFPFDMGKLVTYGHRYVEEEIPDGRVLTDK